VVSADSAKVVVSALVLAVLAVVDVLVLARETTNVHTTAVPFPDLLCDENQRFVYP
jgi:hypothetical protein